MSNLYIKTIDTFKLTLNFNEIGSNLEDMLRDVLCDHIGNKCSKHGYIKSDSIKILNYSSGILKSESMVDFFVMSEFNSCHPSEGLRIECIVENITKAGIRANVEGEPHIIVFIARDHNFANEKFVKIEEGQKIIVDIIGTKYELNDENIYIIGEFVNSLNKKTKMVLK